MNYATISAITSQKYGFQVKNWDDDRGSLGERIVRKIQYHNPELGDFIGDPSIEVINKNLSQLTNEEIAAEFQRVMQESQAVVVPVHEWGSIGTTTPKTFRATVISTRGGMYPFLFVLGVEVEQNNSSL